MTVPTAPKTTPPYLPTKDNYTPTHPDLFRIQFAEGDFNSCLKTARSFKKGEVICPIEKTLPGTKAYSSVQVLPDPPLPGQDQSRVRHIELNSDLLYVNHSCAPNVAFKVPSNESEWRVEALEDLAEGTIMTFAYFTTEWDMQQPFECLCGSKDCLGVITGARQISRDVLGRYFINEHILQMKDAQAKETSGKNATTSPVVAQEQENSA